MTSIAIRLHSWRTCFRLTAFFAVLGLSGVIFTLPCHAGLAPIPARFKGIILYAPDPEYPRSGRGNWAAGPGIYRLIINPKTGLVDEVAIVRKAGSGELDALAVMTFFKWKFRPGAIQRITVPVAFERYISVLLDDAVSK